MIIILLFALCSSTKSFEITNYQSKSNQAKWIFVKWTANGLKILFSNAAITPNFILSLRLDFCIPSSTILFLFSLRPTPTLGVLLRSSRAKGEEAGLRTVSAGEGV